MKETGTVDSAAEIIDPEETLKPDFVINFSVVPGQLQLLAKIEQYLRQSCSM
jgi:hypothetical protein